MSKCCLEDKNDFFFIFYDHLRSLDCLRSGDQAANGRLHGGRRRKGAARIFQLQTVFKEIQAT